MMKIKKCGTCLTEKDIADFYLKKSGRFGVAGSCKDCICNKMQLDHNKNRDRNIKRMRRYRYNNLEYLQFYDRLRYAKDPNSRLKYVRDWRLNFPEKHALSSKKWVQNNRGRKNAGAMKRYVAKLRAVPVWLTEEQHYEIIKIYKERPKGYHVDHIIPLNGKNVSGLHVPWNLQYLLAVDNLRKGNKVA